MKKGALPSAFFAIVFGPFRRACAGPPGCRPGSGRAGRGVLSGRRAQQTGPGCPSA